MNAHLTLAELEAAMPGASGSPQDRGAVDMIVARPGTDQRMLLERAELDVEYGLVGDDWCRAGSPNPDAQITLMNSRVIQLLARDRASWQWAGDQLYVDLDLSEENLPPGSRLAIGNAVLEVTELPHTGCSKFSQRYGADAVRFVNTAAGRAQRRRGMYARVVQPGAVRVGDTIAKVK